jgi:pyruvate kinase
MKTTALAAPPMTSMLAKAKLCATESARVTEPSKTKLVCTLGPATAEVAGIRGLIDAGANVIRLNFSHADHAWHTQALRDIRAVAAEMNRPVAIMQDLCGPKIRLSKVVGDEIAVTAGDTVRITTDRYLSENPSAEDVAYDIVCSYGSLGDDVQPGDTILIDDGRIALEVLEASAALVVTRVRHGGTIRKGKGLNLPGVSLSTPSVTDKDWRDLQWAIEQDVDFVALSFVRHPNDLAAVKNRLEEAGSRARLIAKIERPEAIEHFDEILELADAIMVARGDLGLETELARVPLLQKHLIERARQAGKPVITATQMLESMVVEATPTRAEVSDVANAILDGSDAIMLSAETATGRNPEAAVRMLGQVAHVTESDHASRYRAQWDQSHVENSASAIVEGAAVTATSLGARRVIVYSQSGETARQMARYHLPMPVVAVTNVESTYRQLTLSYGVQPIFVPSIATLGQLLDEIDRLVVDEQLGKVGDVLVVVSALDGRDGNTDTLHVRHVRV